MNKKKNLGFIHFHLYARLEFWSEILETYFSYHKYYRYSK